MVRTRRRTLALLAGHTCSRLPKKFQWRNGCSCSLTGQFVGFVSRAGLGTCSRSSFWHETARNARPNIMFALGKRHGHSGVVYHQLPGQQQDCLPFCEQDRSRRSQFFYVGLHLISICCCSYCLVYPFLFYVGGAFAAWSFQMFPFAQAAIFSVAGQHVFNGMLGLNQLKVSSKLKRIR